MIEYILYTLSAILAITSWNFLKISERNRYLSYSAILFAIVDVLSLLSYHFYQSGASTFYRIVESISGFIYLFMSAFLFIGIHNYLYTRKSKIILTMAPIAPIIINAETTLPSVSLLVAYFFLGVTSLFAFLVFVLALMVYRVRKGGSAFWLLIALFALFLLIAPVSSAIVSFMEKTGEVTIGLSHLVKSLFIFIANLNLFGVGLYYNKKIYPIVKELEEE